METAKSPGTTAYERSVALTGDGQQIIGFAEALFKQSGYRIVEVTPTRVTARHEGGGTRSRSGGTMYGASPIAVSVAGDRLTVSAGFGGVDKLKRFLVRFLVGMAVAMGGGMGLIFHFVFEEPWLAYFGLGVGAGIPLVQLPIHLLLTPRIVKKRAYQALDTLIHNLQLIFEPESRVVT